MNSTNTTTILATDDATTVNLADKYKQLKIISSVVIVATLLLVGAIGYLLYKKICGRSHRSKHGVELVESHPNGKGKREYYDQFGVDTNELTVNSVTAIICDEDEKPFWKPTLSGSRSSGIDCDMPSSDDAREVQRINTGKRVFQVNKVPERAPRQQSGQLVIRLHRGIADAARSLQAADGQNYTLALIDKQSKTIHNIDLRNYRTRPRGKSPLAATGNSPPRKVASSRRRLHSCGDTSGPSTSGTGRRLAHDSPDMGRKTKVSLSADEVMKESSCNSLTDSSECASEVRQRSPSLSSKEGSDAEPTAKLLRTVHISGLESESE